MMRLHLRLRLAADFARRAFFGVRRLGVRRALERGIALVTDPRAPSRSAYRRWLAEAPRVNAADGPRARLSLVCPVHDAEPAWLESLYASVAAADDVPFELRFADDGSQRGDTRAALAAIAARDARVRWHRSEAAAGISAATNAAARGADGDVLVFVDHDDEVSAPALDAIARAFARDPALDLAYTDEDQITEPGLALAPVFKPGAAPVLALSHNYVGHLLAMRRGLFERLGGLRSAFDGSQDHDLVLRGFEAARRVAHLGLIGYHWRRARTSVAGSASAKPWAFERGRLAVEEACARRGIAVDAVEHGARDGLYRVRPARPSGAPCAARVLVHGPQSGRQALVQALADTGLVAPLDVFSDRWPEPDSSPLLIVDAALAPRRDDWEELLRWAALPGVGAVAASGVARGRRADLGRALAPDGRSDPIRPGCRADALGPGLLGAGPREVAGAAGGLLFVEQPCAEVSEQLRGGPVDAAGQVLLSLAGWSRGRATLFLPDVHAPTRGRVSSVGPVDLASQPGWPALRDALPAELWEDGRDRFCPRHDLLDAFGHPSRPPRNA